MLQVSKVLTTKAIRCYLPLLALAAACSSQTSPPCQISRDGISDTPITGASAADLNIALTIDGSPTAQTSDVADLLTNKQISAAFFIVGQKLEASGTDILSHLRAGGHLLGNATYSGGQLDQAPLPAGELRKVDQQLTPFVVGDMFFFRAPKNAFNHKLAAYLNRQGLQKYVGPVGWDVAKTDGGAIDSGCWSEGLTPSACAQRYVDAINDKRKGIVRFTDGSSQLFGLLQELIPALQAANYKFLRLDQVPELRRDFQERGALVDTSGGSGGCNDYKK